MASVAPANHGPANPQHYIGRMVFLHDAKLLCGTIVSEITVMTDVRDFTNIWLVQIGVIFPVFVFGVIVALLGSYRWKAAIHLAKLAGLASTSISNAWRSRHLRLYEAPILQH